MDATVTPPPQQARLLEHAKMFRNAGNDILCGPATIRNALIAPCQVCENAASRRVGERGKSSIQDTLGIFNHLVECI